MTREERARLAYPCTGSPLRGIHGEDEDREGWAGRQSHARTHMPLGRESQGERGGGGGLKSTKLRITTTEVPPR